MKACVFLAAMLVAGSLAAQPDKKIDETTKSVAVPHNVAGLLTVKPDQPNEIQGRRVTYSGVAVQVIKTKNPLQLVNPFAPPEYGYGSANLDRDIITGKTTGFKFFSIKF